MAPDEAAPLPSLPVRLVQVFVSPGALFDRLKERPVWFGALLTGAVLVAVGVLGIPAEVWGEFMRAQLLESGQPVPEELGAGGGFIRIFGVVGGVVGWFVWAFLLAGIATVVFAFLLGDDMGYRQLLSGVAHALLITAVGGVVTLPLKIAAADPQLTLNVGTLLPFADGWLGAWLRTMDLFALWSSVVLGIAVSRFDRRRSAGVAVSILVALSLAIGAVFAVFAA